MHKLKALLTDYLNKHPRAQRLFNYCSLRLAFVAWYVRHWSTVPHEVRLFSMLFGKHSSLLLTNSSRGFSSQAEVFFDEKWQLPYVIDQGKRLYFPALSHSLTTSQIWREYQDLSLEQEPTCPHCYCDEQFRLSPGEVLADIGAAEGIFALRHIELIKHAYLFECEERWLKPLQATFAPYQEKVTIVPARVASSEAHGSLTLDGYFGDKQVDFIKADIEGAERDMLEGGQQLLASALHLKLALCTYHQVSHESAFRQQLEAAGFSCSHTPGYIFLRKPELGLRRGVLRASK